MAFGELRRVGSVIGSAPRRRPATPEFGLKLSVDRELRIALLKAPWDRHELAHIMHMLPFSSYRGSHLAAVCFFLLVSRLPDLMREDRASVAKRAAELKAQGLTLREIGYRIGRSEGEVSKLVSAAKAVSVVAP